MFTSDKSRLPTLFLCCCLSLTLAACGGGGGSSDSSDTASSSTATNTTTDDSTASDSSSTSDTEDSSDSASSSSCAAGSHITQVVCTANAFLDTLVTSERLEVVLDWSDSEAKTVWSNLPGVNRNGLRFGDLDSESLAAAMAVARAVLSDAGYEDFQGILAADDYLSENGGGSQYGSDNYYIAFIGEPSVSGDWMVQIGGHHLAYNITYQNGVGQPTPNHFAAEPKAAFEINSTTYAPIADEGNAMVAMFDALSSSELSQAFLNQTYADVLVGPDNGSGTLPTDYPTGSNRTGVLVSNLSSSQQALVIAAIEQWVSDFPEEVSKELLATYTSESALADTYIAWAGNQSAGVDVDRSGTYMRIDGPRLWIEVACQTGVIFRNTTHYHTMYRDKPMDYGASL